MASTNLLPLRNSLTSLFPSLHKSISNSLLSFSYSIPPPSFQTSFNRPVNPFEQSRLVCRMCEYKFPDPIPEFADHETEKFREHMLQRLTKKNEYFGDSIQEIVDICTEV